MLSGSLGLYGLYSYVSRADVATALHCDVRCGSCVLGKTESERGTETEIETERNKPGVVLSPQKHE